MNSCKPAAHNAASPYLLVSDVARILVFLRTTFDAVELYRQALPDGKIKHAEARIDDSVVMMGERPDGRDPVHCSTHVYVPDVDVAYQRALAAGATSIAESQDQPYGDRTSDIRDSEDNIRWIGTPSKGDLPKSLPVCALLWPVGAVGDSACTEDCLPHPHDRRAFLDRQFVVT